MSFATSKICPPAVRRGALAWHAREIFWSALIAAWNFYVDRGSREQGRSHVASPDGDQEASPLNRRARREIGAAPLAELLIQISATISIRRIVSGWNVWNFSELGLPFTTGTSETVLRAIWPGRICG